MSERNEREAIYNLGRTIVCISLLDERPRVRAASLCHVLQLGASDALGLEHSLHRGDLLEWRHRGAREEPQPCIVDTCEAAGRLRGRGVDG